jgi:hypothetical protein
MVLEACEDPSPLAVGELGVDPMEQMHVGGEGRVCVEVMLHDFCFRERSAKALNGPRSIVGSNHLEAMFDE